MGMASSTESNSRYDLIVLDNLELLGNVKREDIPEKEKVARHEAAEAICESLRKELRALFTPKLGESTTDRPKEVDTERDEDDEVLERFSDFMKGGGCKESFKALGDCVENTQSIIKCKEHLPILKKCMDAHIGYYEPILALAKATEEKMFKRAMAIFIEHRNQPPT